jgi:ppGpp synthetase/RelA/SpoT-type nucleotidyltranferase
MNFADYEQKFEALFAEFAGVVRFILDTSMAARGEAAGYPRLQSIQFRAKAASHLKPKLDARGLLGCADIEKYIKDLAGARIIFYTNTDVDRFLQSGLIPESFDVDWDETRVHHPLRADAESRYRAIHYTVRLSDVRLSLPEYAKFKGMRCEIQIQTILNHAWSETSHDILYKRPQSPGFGSREMASIEKRLSRIMDEHLLPAGYELQKVQHDFERLMQGKALFDRGEIAALQACTSNNERHDVLGRMREIPPPPLRRHNRRLARHTYCPVSRV